MPQHIMVPLDGSVFSEQALAPAVAIAQRSGARLELVRVHTPPVVALAAGLPVPAGAQVNAELRRADGDYLERMAATATAAGVAVHTTVLTGLIGDAIALHVESSGADLVVMCTHGRAGLKRVMLGSVAERVIASAHVPVLLIRPQSAGNPHRFEPQHVLVALDGSEFSEPVIERALELATVMGARLTLMHALLQPSILYGEVTQVADQIDVQALRNDGLRYLDNLAQGLRARGITVETALTESPRAADAILDAAKQRGCGLIALATHARTGFARVALGSVTERVVHDCGIPVLVLRPAAGK